MDNAAVMAGQRRMSPLRLAAAASAVALAIAVVITLLQGSAQAQIVTIQQIVCPILLNLANAFGGFLAGLFNALLAAFGCGISG